MTLLLGYRSPWAYGTLLELSFEHRDLLEVRDQSVAARELREWLDAQLTEQKRRFPTPEWIRNCFSLSYEDKARWIK